MAYILINYLKYDLPEDAKEIINYGFNVSVVCLVILFCFVNVFGYLLVLYLIKTKDLGNRYPKYKKLINYYEKSNILIIIESIIGFLSLIALIIAGLAFIYVITT